METQSAKVNTTFFLKVHTIQGVNMVLFKTLFKFIRLHVFEFYDKTIYIAV